MTTGLLAAFVAIAAPCAAEWRRIDSPNFAVVGDVSERTLRSVAVKFEGFRETLTRVLTERATATPVPTVVIVFPSDRAFTPFKPTYQGKPVPISGLVVASQDANYIAIVADGGVDGLRVVFHEYAHLVVSNVMRNVPTWLNEGLAEFYSTYELGDGGREAVLGRPIVHHLQRLQDTQLLKLDDLLNVDEQSPLYNEANRSSVFYAQSWALAHRILLGEPRRMTELGTYLQQVTEGIPPAQAWQQAFGAANMDRELNEYVRNRSFKAVQYKFPDKLAKFDTAVTAVPAADAEAFLAEFLIQQERIDEAAARLSLAAKLDPESVRVKVAGALLAVARAEDDNAGTRLLAVSPTDWLAAYSALMGIAAMVEDRDGTASPEQLFAARRLVAIVGQHRPQVPNALARLAMMELRSAAGPTKETLRAIERARLMASGREDYAFIHAQVLAGLSDFDAARKVVGPLMSPAYPPAVRESARNLMRQVLRLQTAAQSSSGRSTEPGAAAPSAAEGARSERPESGLSRAAGRRAAPRRRARAHRVPCRRGRRLPPPNGRRPGQRDGGRPRGSGLHHLPERSCQEASVVAR